MQNFVYGDSLQNNLVGIVVPEKAEVEKWAASKNLTIEDYDEFLKNEELNKHIQNEIRLKAREAGFFGFEIPTKIHLTSTAFSVENDILTPTFKLKRNEAKLYFYSQIKDLYDGAKLQGEE